MTLEFYSRASLQIPRLRCDLCRDWKHTGRIIIKHSSSLPQNIFEQGTTGEEEFRIFNSCIYILISNLIRTLLFKVESLYSKCGGRVSFEQPLPTFLMLILCFWLEKHEWTICFIFLLPQKILLEHLPMLLGLIGTWGGNYRLHNPWQ